MLTKITIMPLVILLFFSSFLIQTGLAIRCYSCTSQLSDNIYNSFTNCSDPAKLYPYECTSNLVNEMNTRISNIIGSNSDDYFRPFEQTVCQKLELQLPNGEIFLSRSCQMGRIYSIDPCKKFEETLRYNHGFKLRHCSTCDRDVCNSAPVTATSVSFGAIVALVALAMHHHFWLTFAQ